jgi:hypothetical protein
MRLPGVLAQLIFVAFFLHFTSGIGPQEELFLIDFLQSNPVLGEIGNGRWSAANMSAACSGWAGIVCNGTNNITSMFVCMYFNLNCYGRSSISLALMP